ncbi:MAG: hypothetical protein ACU843_13470 [Gammaproteobacteria bacterium]
MFKFLPAIVLVQLITIGLTITAFIRFDDRQLVLIISLFAFLISILASFWFSSIGRELYHDSLTRIRENHIREKEEIIINTEREKAEIVNQSYRQRDTEIRRAYAKANFKVGVFAALGATAGAALIFSQLITFGLTLLVASASGLAGYLLRARQERISQKIAMINPENHFEKPAQPKLLQSK